jgi:hypothetical protein
LDIPPETIEVAITKLDIDTVALPINVVVAGTAGGGVDCITSPVLNVELNVVAKTLPFEV